MARAKKVVVEEVVPEVVEEVSSVCTNCNASGTICSVCHFDPYATDVV